MGGLTQNNRWNSVDNLRHRPAWPAPHQEGGDLHKSENSGRVQYSENRGREQGQGSI